MAASATQSAAEGPETSFPKRKKVTVTRSTSARAKCFDPPYPWPADHVERRPLASLIAYARNARKHGPKQIAELAASMREFGWTMPLLVDPDGKVIVGHGRILAAQQLIGPLDPGGRCCTGAGAAAIGDALDPNQA